MPPHPAPPGAREVFGDGLPVVERYAELLAGPGVERGLIGPREVDRLWDRHLINCAVMAEAVPQRADVVDIGSGAGLPGIVLSIVRTDLSLTLLEPLLRRTIFLSECVSGLDLANVAVRRARAEEVVGEYVTDVVTARAVAPLVRLVPWALPLLKPGGELLALKGALAQTELEEATPVLRRFDVRAAEVLQVGHGRVDPPATIVRVVAGRPSRTGDGRERVGRGSGRRRRQGRKR